MMKLNISKDFSRTPGPRARDEGKFSGEEFLEDLLYPKLKTVIDTKSELEINLDGTAGYGTSFLEEAFGGLIRKKGLAENQILKHIKLISNNEPYLIDDIKEYLADAQRHST